MIWIVLDVLDAISHRYVESVDEKRRRDMGRGQGAEVDGQDMRYGGNYYRICILGQYSHIRADCFHPAYYP